MRTSAATMTMVLSTGCGTAITADLRSTEPKVTHEEALAACGLGGVTAVVPYEFDVGFVTITETCAIVLGEAIGMDWSTFGADAAEFSVPADISQLLIAAAWFLMASDLGTREDACGMLPDGAPACTELGDYGGQDSALNPSLFELVSGHTHRTFTSGWNPERVAEVRDGAVDWSDPLWVSFLFRSGPSEVAVAQVASAMAHEAGHDFLAPHIDECGLSEDSCDVDGSGAYGLGAAVLALRHARLDTLLPETCSWEQISLENTCSSILDTDGLGACEDQVWDCSM